MSLDQLRGFMRDWANDPHGEIFDTNRTHTLINTAYQDVVRKIDKARHAWVVPREAAFLTVTITDATKREYDLDSLLGEQLRPRRLRKVIEVRDASGGGDYDTYPRLDVVDWERRNEASSGCYLFRAHNTAGVMAWHLGLVVLPTGYTSLVVAAVQSVQTLTSDTDVPDEVPSEYHEAIGYRAAMLGLMQEHEDPQEVAALYGEAMMDFEIGLGDGGRGRLESTRL